MKNDDGTLRPECKTRFGRTMVDCVVNVPIVVGTNRDMSQTLYGIESSNRRANVACQRLQKQLQALTPREYRPYPWLEVRHVAFVEEVKGFVPVGTKVDWHSRRDLWRCLRLVADDNRRNLRGAIRRNREQRRSPAEAVGVIFGILRASGFGEGQ